MKGLTLRFKGRHHEASNSSGINCRKSITSIATIFLLCLSMSLQAQTPDGTAANPFLIDDVDDLQAFRDGINTGAAFSYWNNSSVTVSALGNGQYFKLTTPIDLSSVCYYFDGTEANDVSWTPIGTYQNSNVYFKGHFDGSNNLISNLYINKPNSKYQGLFGAIYDACIENIDMYGADITGSNYVASVCGFITGNGTSTISRCIANSCDVAGYQYVGGICGDINNTTLSYCSNGINDSGQVSGHLLVGGIVGRANSSSSVSYCTNKSIVNSIGDDADYLGGLCGTLAVSSISHCTNSANVSGKNDVGGVIGYVSLSTVEYCINKGYVFGNKKVGGVTGRIFGNISTSSTLQCCINNGTTTGTTYVGGLIGESETKVTVQNSTNNACVSGVGNVGGLIGRSINGVDNNTNTYYNSDFLYCTNNGSVTGERLVGGVTGSASSGSIIRYCANAGNVSSTGSFGGICGEVINYAITVTDCYYDKQMCPATYAVGNNSGFKLL